MNIKELERVAKAATPGPWEWVGSSLEPYRPDGWIPDVIDAEVSCGAYCLGGSVELNLKPTDEAFIAAANPQTVLALLDRIEALQRLCGRAADTLETAMDVDCCMRDEAFVAELREAAKG